MPPENINPLYAIADYGLQAAGAYIYAMINPLPGSSWNYSPSANQIFLDNGYTASQTAFRDASLARRVRVLEENAKKFGLDPEIIRNNAYWIQMLMRADTAETRAMIRDKLGQVGNLLLWLFDSFTGAEPGADQLYSGFADPYGTRSGNESALYAANYAENYIRSQEINPDGTRSLSAGMFAGGLDELKKFHYNFATAVGADKTQRTSRSELFSGVYNQTGDDGSFSNQALRTTAQASYIRNLLDNTTDEAEKKQLNQLLTDALSGKLNTEELPEKFRGFSIEDFASRNDAKLYSEAVLQDIQNQSGYYAKFKEYAKENKFELTLKESASEEEKAKHAKKLAELENSFALDVVDDYLNAAPADRKYKDVQDSKLEQVHEAIKEVDKKWSEDKAAEEREVRRVGEFTRAMYAVGQANWSSLSIAEQQQLLDASGSDLEAAKTRLGGTLNNKFAASYMNQFKITDASMIGLQIEAGRQSAHLSKDELSQNAAFMGSILQNKNLLPTTVMASNAWIAAAERKLGPLDPFEIQAANQRIVRATESSEGRMMYMFMAQDIKEGTPEYDIQQALKTGKPLTKEQYDYLKKGLSDPGSFMDAIAKATGKTTDILNREAQHLEINRDRQDGVVQGRISNIVAQIAGDTWDDSLITNESMYEIISEKSAKNLAQAGLSKDKKSAKLLTDLVQSNLVDKRKVARGDLTEEELKDLEANGYKNVADYGRERKRAKENALKGITDEKERGLAEAEFNRASEHWIRQIYADAVGDEQAEKILGRNTVDVTDTNKAQYDAAKKDYMEAQAPAAPKDLTATQTVGAMLGKQIPADNPINGFFKSLLNTATGGIGGVLDAAKSLLGGSRSDTATSGKEMASAFGDALLTMFQDSDFQTKFREAYITAIGGGGEIG